MKQEFNNYKHEDFKVWKMLFERQFANLQDKGCDEYILALERMKDVLHADSIANFKELNEWFRSATNWEITCVPGLIPVEDFFQLLAQKKFCSSTWLRPMNQLDYLEEPDMFHDIFGHVPLLSDPIFSAFTHEFGRLGRSISNDPKRVIMLQRLYWFTIEFGLIRQQGMKIYGAGIISSFGESNLSLSGKVPIQSFDIEKVISTEFRTDQLQTHYIVIDSFEQLFETALELSKKWKSYELDRK